ncbi:MAG TPA: hypothetical protein VKA66_06940, partial [Mycobacterium sp.]|nr:hypothetical protein [Mycobacterium sp.]
MTTKSRPAKGRPAARSGSPARGRSARSGTAAGHRGTRAGSRRAHEKSWASGLWEDHSADLLAIGLVTVAVLLGLALYGGAAGFVGSGVNKGLGLVIGWTRYLVPPACVLAGVLIVAGRTRPHRWRIVAGGVLGLLSVAGLA